MNADTGRRRWARALVGVYPPGWRDRYGGEFEQLLIDQLAERRRSPAWWADVVGHAIWARLSETGVVGDLAPVDRRIRSTGRWLAFVGAAFVLCGMAVWSQLAVGWQWSAPAGAGTRSAVEVLSLGLLVLGGVGAAALLVLAAGVVRAVRCGAAIPWGPILVVTVAVALLVVCSGSVGAMWPGTGGHAWAGRTMMPAWLGRRTWALTLWISSFWAHPRELRALGAAAVGWMIATPLLTAGLGWALARLAASASYGRTSRRLLIVAACGVPLAMVLVVAGAATWALGGVSGPHGLYVAGLIDVALVALAAGQMLLATHLGRRLVLAVATARA